MNRNAPPDAARRRMLAAARNLGAASAAAAVLGPASGIAAPQAAATPEREPALPEGYRETARIRRYYQLARY